MKNLELEITGMSCGHCVARVTKALGKVAGVQVESVEVGKARVQYEAPQTEDAIRKAVDDLGFQVVAARS
jgi:copper chaperone